MAVDEDCRRVVAGMEPVAADDGMAAGLRNLDILDAGATHLAGEPFRGPAAVRRVLGHARHAGDPQEVHVRRDASVAGLVEVRLERGEVGGCGGHRVSFSARCYPERRMAVWWERTRR